MLTREPSEGSSTSSFYCDSHAPGGECSLLTGSTSSLDSMATSESSQDLLTGDPKLRSVSQISHSIDEELDESGDSKTNTLTANSGGSRFRESSLSEEFPGPVTNNSWVMFDKKDLNDILGISETNATSEASERKARHRYPSTSSNGSSQSSVILRGKISESESGKTSKLMSTFSSLKKMKFGTKKISESGPRPNTQVTKIKY